MTGVTATLDRRRPLRVALFHSTFVGKMETIALADKNHFSKFDLDAPKLPDSIREQALMSADYPYKKRLTRADYAEQLIALQKQLVKLQSHLGATDERVALVFEGRDAAGKGGAIKRYMQHLNPRQNRVVALPKPSDREHGQWYFQRYIAHLPGAGETALFDRSWYNRAGVEPVMGFCSPAQTAHFLQEAPRFEKMVLDDGIHFFKFWLDIGQEMQLKRFHDRRHDALKVWKLSPIDLEAPKRWDAYTVARDNMLAATDSSSAPWTVILANDKRRARLNLIRQVLLGLDFEGKNTGEIGSIDPQIVLDAQAFLARNQR